MLASVAERARAANGRRVVLVSDIPFADGRLSPTYTIPSAVLERVRARLRRAQVLKADSTTGSWTEDGLWQADMQLFVEAQEAYACTSAASEVCEWCAWHDKCKGGAVVEPKPSQSQSGAVRQVQPRIITSSTEWLLAQRKMLANKDTHASWLDALDGASRDDAAEGLGALECANESDVRNITGSWHLLHN